MTIAGPENDASTRPPNKPPKKPKKPKPPKPTRTQADNVYAEQIFGAVAALRADLEVPPKPPAATGKEPAPGSAAAFRGVACESPGAAVAAGAGADFRLSRGSRGPQIAAGVLYDFPPRHP